MSRGQSTGNLRASARLAAACPSGAQQAGLHSGDTILAFDGHPQQDFTKISLNTALASADEPIHVMRSFRVNHPAGKMFVAWICGPKGRRLVGSLHAYRAPAA